MTNYRRGSLRLDLIFALIVILLAFGAAQNDRLSAEFAAPPAPTVAPYGCRTYPY